MYKFDIFSKRQNPIQHEIYTYEKIPEKLRNQIFFIWKNGLAIDSYTIVRSNVPYQSFNFIKEIMCKEHGLLSLSEHSYKNDVGAECVDFLRYESDPLKVLDIIEISLYVMKILSENKSTYELESIGITQTYDEVIEDLNDRFKENGVGYTYLGNKIVRRDSEFLHENAVKPAISLLYESEFEGAAEEFLHAHELFRIGKNKEAIVEALKSFESTMKTICNKKVILFREKELQLG